MKNFIALFLFMMLFYNSFGQEYKKEDILSTTLRYHYGAVLPHHKSISYLVNDQIRAIELNLGFLPDTTRKWANLYNQPEIGIGIYHTSLGNKEILGNATALYPYINFPLKKGKKLSFELQTGIGIAYAKKHFDPVDNFSNVAIGSKFTAFFKLLSDISYRINPKLSVSTGIGFCHLSNGAFRVPNKGLNMLTANFGLKYNLKGKTNYTPIKKSIFEKLDNHLLLIWNNGVKQVKVIDTHKYYVTNLSCNYAFGINSKQRIGFGIDFFYDTSANRGSWNKNPETGFKDRFSQSVFVSHDLVIDKFTLVANVGVYTFYKTKPSKPVYSRVGLRYQFHKNLFGNLGLKAHLGKADFIELGLGYKFSIKKHGL